MAPVPLVPDRYREVQRVPRTEPPDQSDASPAIVVQGHGWKFTAPIALAVAAAGIFAGRTTASDPSQAITEMRSEMRAELADIHREVTAIKEAQMRADNATANRMTVLEARLARIAP